MVVTPRCRQPLPPNPVRVPLQACVGRRARSRARGRRGGALGGRERDRVPNRRRRPTEYRLPPGPSEPPRFAMTGRLTTVTDQTLLTSAPTFDRPEIASSGRHPGLTLFQCDQLDGSE